MPASGAMWSTLMPIQPNSPNNPCIWMILRDPTGVSHSYLQLTAELFSHQNCQQLTEKKCSFYPHRMTFFAKKCSRLGAPRGIHEPSGFSKIGTTPTQNGRFCYKISKIMWTAERRELYFAAPPMSSKNAEIPSNAKKDTFWRPKWVPKLSWNWIPFDLKNEHSVAECRF